MVMVPMGILLSGALGEAVGQEKKDKCVILAERGGMSTV